MARLSRGMADPPASRPLEMRLEPGALRRAHHRARRGCVGSGPAGCLTARVGAARFRPFSSLI